MVALNWEAEPLSLIIVNINIIVIITIIIIIIITQDNVYSAVIMT